MDKNSIEFATAKQHDFAESVKKRIINDLSNMDNINKFNQIANTNFEKKKMILNTLLISLMSIHME